MNHSSYGDGRDADAEPPRRRPRGRFRLTADGASALDSYRREVRTAQMGTGGRTALEGCQAAWAQARGLGGRDALVLEEIGTRPQNAIELARSLADCSMARAAVQDCIDRLSQGGLIELTLPVQPSPPSHPGY